MIDPQVAKTVLSFMKQSIVKEDVIALLESVDNENGFMRGSIGQCAHSIIDVSEQRVALLTSIAFDESISEETRFWAMLLLIDKAQRRSKEEATTLIRRYLEAFPNSEFSVQFRSALDDIQQHGWIDFY